MRNQEGEKKEFNLSNDESCKIKAQRRNLNEKSTEAENLVKSSHANIIKNLLHLYLSNTQSPVHTFSKIKSIIASSYYLNKGERKENNSPKTKKI